MCIEASVGVGCANQPADVKIVQILLNMHEANPALATDGFYGNNTITAIKTFQAAKGQSQPSGRVDVGDATVRLLKENLPGTCDANALQAVMTNASAFPCPDRAGEW